MKIFIIFSIFLIFSFSFLNFAFAYNWDTDPLSLSWSAMPANPIYLDLNKDGYIDCIYTYALSSGNYTITRYLGDNSLCVSSASVAIGGTANERIKIYDDEIWFGASSSTIKGWVSVINVTDGSVTPNYFSQQLDRMGHSVVGWDFIQNDWGTPTIAVAGASFSIAVCSGGGTNYCGDLEIANSTTTLADDACNSGGGSPSAGAGGKLGYVTASVSGVCTFSHTFNTAHDATSENSPYSFGSWCSSTQCTNALAYTSATFGNYYISDTVKMYADGIELENEDWETTGGIARSQYFTDYFVVNDSYEQVLKLHYKILDNSLTSPVPFALYNYNGVVKILNLGSTDQIADFPSTYFSNRAWELVVLDDYTGASTFNLKESNTAMTNYPHTLTDGSTTWNSVNMYGAFVLPSGYLVKPDSGATSRQISSEFTNENNLQPTFVGPTTGLTTLTVEVKNSPSSNFVLLFESQLTLTNERYVWSVMPLTADKTVSVDLPTGLCVYVSGVDTSSIVSQVTEFGLLCASGTMPKTITYSANLSFTFWSLPYGVSHTFTQDTSILTTKIRHDTIPYNYTVKIYDSSNVLQYDNEFTGNATGIVSESINATGISLPAMLKVFDVNNNQLYYASIGTPSYLSSNIAWFTTWFSIDGFNILFLLPLIFSAMFTRNTVGVGTTLTVVFIATLTWFGILPIPDIVIYFMIVIAIIGTIAYKKLYD